MSDDALFTPSNSWFRRAVGITVAVFALTAVGGFVVLPYAQPDLKLEGLWDAICSAAGVPRKASSAEPVAPARKLSQAIVTSSLPGTAAPDAVGRGATLAHSCAICHGPTGVSRADSPNLAGQYAAVVYKQLLDYKSGARVNAVMTPFALALSERDMADLAAYYAFLPRLPGYHPQKDLPAAPRIVLNGAPLRNIAPCGSCHGALDNKAGSPWLEGQPAAYVKSQLQAFASGARSNDISQQMRNIARRMTPEEIDEAAEWYASRPPVPVAAYP
jgi:cytochrome c553